ncbi:MAG: methyltransferase domain-containing protein [Gammaproteobacteria bacterium]|nr:methyltransferase domain-containing protein [Gammaproteobacteria bacterium]
MSANFYNQHAEKLAQQYLSKTFEEVHAGWLAHLNPLLQRSDVRILDLGAGAGRDSKYFAQQGQGNNLQVTAIEPAQTLADIGMQQTQGLNVQWLSDSLPALSIVTKQEISFDLILLSAVWMHIPQSDRARSIRKLANLLKPGGKLVISLRHGPSGDERVMHQVSVDELTTLAKTVGLFPILITGNDSDKLGRSEVTWQTVVLALPDDGSGAFPFIRHVALNDGKSGTHKLALMRVLLRIADGHPGAVIRREDNRVILPAGLVALYWCHQYKILIDDYNLFQTPNDSINMGFMKENGWHQLSDRNASDYCVGHLFEGNDAKAVHRMISAAVLNIKNMPCKYITLPNSKQSVFEVDNNTVKAKDSLFLDMVSLSQWGEFSLPEHIWLSFSRFACWVEPVLVSEWANTMEKYKGNASVEQQANILKSLQWLEAKRTTVDVRARFDQINTDDNPQRCVWSQKRLTLRGNMQSNVQIDHCFPFARWPNNDLWNLLPTDAKTNLEKSDRLPTKQRMAKAKDHISHWWQTAWLDNNNQALSKQFFAQANIALPGLKSDNTSIDDLFEALTLQRGRLKDMQQLREW